MSASVRNKQHKNNKGDMKEETVLAQVHKPYRAQDNEEKHCQNTPSRDISVDEESQINSKIISLIESEMKRDANKHSSHFTDSRPQSLSFYEEEKIPEELSGNLELLSPEERKHYSRKRKETDEMNAYNTIQDLELVKKTKSRRKRHESELGDSREMMIPKEKKKSKKKKREGSPSNTSKKKHRKRDEEFEPKTEITLALDDLQDDVFENNDMPMKQEKVRKSPRKFDKVYVQKKNKFEAIPKSSLNRQGAHDFEEDPCGKKFLTYHPLELAIPFQEYWMRFSTLCHGLLGGLAFGHWLYIISNIYVQDQEFISHYSHFSDIYVCFFYFLSVICLMSVFEKMDFAQLKTTSFKEFLEFRKTTLMIVLYMGCLVVHLSATRLDSKLGLASYNNESLANITTSELTQWNHLSLWRSVLAFLAWIVVGLDPQENMLYINLKHMEKYLPPK